MLAKRPIRLKLLVGLGLLVLVVTILAGSGLYAMYAYRDLVKSLSRRVNELPVAADLSRQVSDLRLTLGKLHELRGRRSSSFSEIERDRALSQIWTVRQQFAIQIQQIEVTLGNYRTRVGHKRRSESQIADNQQERVTVGKIDATLLRVHEANRDEHWIADEGRLDWDDPVTQHIPWFELAIARGAQDAGEVQVTLRDLLCHRTGFVRMNALHIKRHNRSATPTIRCTG